MTSHDSPTPPATGLAGRDEPELRVVDEFETPTTDPSHGSFGL